MRVSSDRRQLCGSLFRKCRRKRRRKRQPRLACTFSNVEAGGRVSSMLQASATAPALLYRGHPCPRRARCRRLLRGGLWLVSVDAARSLISRFVCARCGRSGARQPSTGAEQAAALDRRLSAEPGARMLAAAHVPEPAVVVEAERGQLLVVSRFSVVRGADGHCCFMAGACGRRRRRAMARAGRARGCVATGGDALASCRASVIARSRITNHRRLRAVARRLRSPSGRLISPSSIALSAAQPICVPRYKRPGA